MGEHPAAVVASNTKPWAAFVTASAVMAASEWQVNVSIMPRLDAGTSPRSAAHVVVDLGAR